MSTSSSNMSNPAAQGMLGNYGMSAGGATGGASGAGLSLGGSTNGMNSSTGSNNTQPAAAATGGNSGPPSAMDTINQAYTGIQQYAGLSGLLSQGKSPFFILNLWVFFLFVVFGVYYLCRQVSLFRVGVNLRGCE